MKKILFTLVLLLSVGMVANAQFKFGVKAAANFATTNGDGDDTKVGFSGGILGQYKFNDRWAIQPEVLFNMQGLKQENVKIYFNYVAVPIMAQFYIIKGLHVELGPQVGYLVSAKEKWDSGAEYDWMDDMKKVDVSLNMGVAYDLDVIPIGFFVRFSAGLTKLSDRQDDDLRNQSFQLGAFVKF